MSVKLISGDKQKKAIKRKLQKAIYNIYLSSHALHVHVFFELTQAPLKMALELNGCTKF